MNETANKKTYKTRKLFIACFIMLCAALSVCGSLTVSAFESDNCVAPVSEQSERAELTVTVGKKTYVYKDEILHAPDHTVYEQIERRRINAPLEEKIATVDKCLAAGAKWKEALKYAFPLLPAFVEKIKAETDCEPVDSKIEFKPNGSPMFRISRSKDGVCVDEKRLCQDIYLALRKSPKASVTVYPQSVKAAVCEADNIKLTRKISTFTTSFASSGEGRKNNIRLALGKINGIVLEAGEEFSFNETVGPRTEKNGYSVAKIIVGGEYVEGVGGGVCQASTTLYNAALTAGMEITSVRNHTITPSYVPPSLDAMVNASSSDLRFVNPYATKIFIKAQCVGDNACVTFFGAELNEIIKTESRVISRTQAPPDKEIIDTEYKYVSPDSPPGTKVRVSYSHAGVKSEAYLKYYTRSGRFIREEKIRTDTYAETRGIVAVSEKREVENCLNR